MAPCILYRNDDSDVTLLDIPRSIESAQGDSTKRIISSSPLEHPYPSVEPKSAKAKARLGEVSIEDLLLQKYVQLAFDGLRECYQGPWCLPRATGHPEILARGKKRKRKEILTDETGQNDRESDQLKHEYLVSDSIQNNVHSSLISNHNSSTIYHTTSDGLRARLPPHATALYGDITTTLETFTQSAPHFKLIIMDPPWPNRSARRKSSYFISYSTPEINTLLSSIPLNDHLAEDGLVAVWVTNKVVFRDILLQEGGLFDEWDIELVEEWVWVKVAVNGATICALDSAWRKPYETLLVGCKKGKKRTGNKDVKRRVIVAVPELHSRKPNLKALFEDMMGTEKYEALEIFARNLTADWWAWGNEVLKFQADEHWIDETDL
ncbi:Methyltransferase-like protein [Lachnellula hyalina]|uniref:Methyltransferase-like protein n=1 Tax=Lachnellula hyalina TaxID=1316788 RepID=A0A8H8TYF5_9HELO|nr:Methyltransferase-like protein [Lachnellula hyalina]TVY25330.1 Methyltransferase-like protein [Lachnellula hyalina]